MRDDEVLLTLAQKVDPRHTALLVIDVQNDFCASGGFYDLTGSDTARVQKMIPRLQQFHGTDLDVLLRSRGGRALVLVGVATNVCVEGAARDAVMRDDYVVVVSDCTAARDEQFHRSAVANIEAHFATVVTADAVAGTWKPR
jgi:nicotinamidase-related amidase